MEDPDLSDDLLLLILIRLPVNSLLRFRCVSKSWNLLISTQDFSHMHLNQSLINPKPLGLIWENEFKVKERISRLHISAFDCSKLENFADTIQPLHHPLGDLELMQPTIIGSCNGLLCVTWFDHNEIFYVFNPLTRKGLTFSGEFQSWCPTVRSCYYGFGYDDVHDDYKVVTWGVRPRLFGADNDCSKFDVYSVKDGSWTTTNSGLTDCYTSDMLCGVLVNCALHWIWQNSKGTYNIVRFDLRMEEHRLMETPENHLSIPELDEDDEEYVCKLELGALNGCLCGIVFHYEVPNKLDLWVMNEYGVKDSWTKMTIDMIVDIQFAGGLHTKLGKVMPIVPIVHVENQKQMMLHSYKEGFLLCDMVTNKLLKLIKVPEFDPKRNGKIPQTYFFVPKEFCFQGSLVEPLGFESFHSLWNKQPTAGAAE